MEHENSSCYGTIEKNTCTVYDLNSIWYTVEILNHIALKNIIIIMKLLIINIF